MLSIREVRANEAGRKARMLVRSIGDELVKGRDGDVELEAGRLRQKHGGNRE